MLSFACVYLLPLQNVYCLTIAPKLDSCCSLFSTANRCCLLIDKSGIPNNAIMIFPMRYSSHRRARDDRFSSSGTFCKVQVENSAVTTHRKTCRWSNNAALQRSVLFIYRSVRGPCFCWQSKTALIPAWEQISCEQESLDGSRATSDCMYHQHVSPPLRWVTVIYINIFFFFLKLFC